jgi:hypothetical protein
LDQVRRTSTPRARRFATSSRSAASWSVTSTWMDSMGAIGIKPRRPTVVESATTIMWRARFTSVVPGLRDQLVRGRQPITATSALSSSHAWIDCGPTEGARPVEYFYVAGVARTQRRNGARRSMPAHLVHNYFRLSATCLGRQNQVVSALKTKLPAACQPPRTRRARTSWRSTVPMHGRKLHYLWQACRRNAASDSAVSRRILGAKGRSSGPAPPSTSALLTSRTRPSGTGSSR